MIKGFKDLLGWQGIQGAIDATQIHVQKLKFNVLAISTIIPLNQKGIVCSFKHLLIIRKGSLTFLLGCQGPWMMQEFCVSSVYRKASATWEDLSNE